MKSVIMFCTFLILGFSIMAETTLTLVTEDKENFPYLIGNGAKIEDNKPGIPIEIMKKVEEKLGIKIIIKRMPWKRCLESDLKEGLADMAMSGSYKKEREEFGVYPTKNGKVDESKRIYTAAYSFYRHTDSKATWDGKVLKDFAGSVGAPLGYSIVGDLKGMGYTVEESPNCLNDFMKLSKKRIEVIAELEPQADALLEKNKEFSKVTVKMTPPIAVKPYYVMMSHQFYAKNPKLAQTIWDAIEEVREKELTKLYEKY